MLPNFLVIGAEKSATTWLYKRLKEHPDIFMPDTKEIHFFNKYNSNFKEKDNYKNLGIKWYKFFFKDCDEEKAVGEATPMYLCDKFAPERIKKTIPNVKLIAILRNPIDRAYSHYCMAKAKNHTNLAFKKIVNKKADKFIKRGLYYQQLKKYYQYFNKEDILIILMQDIIENENEVLKTVCDFLDVKASFKFNDKGTSENSFCEYRSPLLLNIISFITDFFRCKIKMGFIIDFFKKIGIAHFLKNINKKDSEYEEMFKDSRTKLADYYREHNKNLSRLIDRDLSHWD